MSRPVLSPLTLPADPTQPMEAATKQYADGRFPATTLGDLIYGGASGAPTRLAGPTTSGTRYMLSMVPSGGLAVAPVWVAFNTETRSCTLLGLSTADSSVITTSDTVLSGLGKLQAQITAGGGGGITLSSALTGFSVGGNTALSATDTILSGFQNLQGQVNARMANPMTTAGDLIYGGSSGTPTRLPINATDGKQLTLVSGLPAWSNPTVVQTYSAGAFTITPAPNCNHCRITLGATATTINMGAGYDGQKVTLEVVQDATGSRTVALGTGFSFGTDITSYTATTTANKADLIGLIYNGSLSAWMVAAIAKGY